MGRRQALVGLGEALLGRGNRSGRLPDRGRGQRTLPLEMSLLLPARQTGERQDNADRGRSPYRSIVFHNKTSYFILE
jgi:hypothetical protein